jgi:tRNA-specific 2-thiouridylase
MKNVYVGMSGGIDSSVCAYMLKEEGYKVTGITFRALTEQGSKKCCSIEEINAAKRVCDFLEIPHKIIDLADLFRAKVINPFISSYKKGLTPNPCVLCNRYVKFGALAELAFGNGADFFATGHYVSTETVDNETFIKRALDKNKDQSYFLSFINKEYLPRFIFPLGKFHKEEIRKKAQTANLPINPHKGESQDVCFIKDDYRDFLEAEGVEHSRGDFIYQGKIAGHHRGIPFYSFGQRRGHKVAVGRRVFIREFDIANNRIILGDAPKSIYFETDNLNIFTSKFTDGVYDIQPRYRSQTVKGKVEIEGVRARVTLEKAYPLLTPGQFAVFYKSGRVFASGVISHIKLE